MFSVHVDSYVIHHIKIAIMYIDCLNYVLQFQMEFNFPHSDNANAVLACVLANFFLHFAFGAVHYHSVVTADVDTLED